MSVFEKIKTEQNNSGATCPANVFTPFGGGQRLCPGYELARVELSVFLHHLVTRFRYLLQSGCRSSPCTRVVPLNILGNAHADLKLIFVCDLVFRTSWTPAGEDKLVFFPTTRTQKRYPINVQRRDRVQAM